MPKNELLRLRHIQTGDTNGLVNFNLELYEREVLLLLGNYISGKEYLRDLLIGRKKGFSGKCFLYGQAIDCNGLHKAFDNHEIFYANPDLSLIPNVSVAENIMIYRNRRQGLLPSRKSIYLMAAEQMDALGLDVDLNAKIRDIDYFSKLAVCIAKAVLYKSRIIIIDYSDNKLDLQEIRDLGFLIEKIRNQSAFLIFSERADEILDLADDVLIISEGRDKKKHPSSMTNQSEIISLWQEDDKYISKRRPIYESAEESDAQVSLNLSGQITTLSPITGVFDPGRSRKMKLADYTKRIMAENEMSLIINSVTHIVDCNTMNQSDIVFIENHDYSKMLSMFPLKYSIVLPRSTKELFSAINHRHEQILVKEFYQQFDFLTNDDRQYSDIFFWKLAAIYRWERFHPSVMILDNPFVQLDAYEEQLLSNYLRSLSERMVIIIIANRINSIDKIAGKILCVDDGKIKMIF